VYDKITHITIMKNNDLIISKIRSNLLIHKNREKKIVFQEKNLIIQR